MNDPLAHTYAPTLQKAGLKVTLPRLLILRAFDNSTERHLNADDVYALLRQEGVDIGLATVYRALTQFSDAGILEKHNFEGGKSVFELNPGTHHDHLICLICGHIVEFVDAEIEGRQKAVADAHGYAISGHALAIYGVCGSPECRASTAGRSALVHAH